MVHPVDCPLEHRGSQSVGVGHAPDILTRSVGYRFVEPGQTQVSAGFVSVDRRHRFRVADHKVL